MPRRRKLISSTTFCANCSNLRKPKSDRGYLLLFLDGKAEKREGVV